MKGNSTEAWIHVNLDPTQAGSRYCFTPCKLQSWTLAACYVLMYDIKLRLHHFHLFPEFLTL